MEFKNEARFQQYVEAWKGEPYEERILSFATEWANLMEENFTPSVSWTEFFKRHADEHCKTADYDGITGCMYNKAIHVLAETWIHGEELAHWHNAESLPPDEARAANEQGKVVNTAIGNFPA